MFHMKTFLSFFLLFCFCCSICKNFDNKLSGILEDGSYYSTVADKPEPVGSFDRYADNEMVENFLCTACETCIFR